MKQKANHKSWILVVVLVAVLVGYVAVFFIPKCNGIAELRKDLLAKQDFIVQSGQTVALLKEVEEQLVNTTAYNRSWTKHAPHSGEISILLGKIHALARSSNVEIESFDPEPAEKHDRLRRLPVAMVYSGQLASVFTFLSRLEQMPQTIWIKGVTISRANKNARKGKDGMRKDRGHAECELELAIFMDNLEISN